MTTPATTTVLVADDHAVVRHGVRSILNAQPDFEVRAEARVGETRAADARLLFHAFAPPIGADDSARFEAWGRETFRRLGGEALV